MQAPSALPTGAPGARAAPRTGRARRWVLPLSVVLAPLALAACVMAPAAITAEVQSYGTWPPGRVPADYAFERLPSQNDDPMTAATLENAARSALAQAGFQPAIDAAGADVKVQVGVRVLRTLVEAWPADPFWPGPWYGPGVSWGVGWGWPARHSAFSIGFHSAPAYATTEREVALVMRDGRSHQVLYETHARYDSRYGGPELLASLFDAALRDFPNGVGRRQVTVPFGPGVPVRAPARGEPVGVPAAASAPAPAQAPQAAASAP
jgi:hypothetical protein